jgi:segregation and condensation protein B
MENLKYIIESLIFVSEAPLSINRLKAILEEVEPGDIRLALAELQGEYDARNGGFTLQEVAGGFQFRTRSTYSDWIKKLLKPSPTRLSRAALETLAIIAYKQPIIRADVEHIRGVDSGGVLRMLLERKLIRVLGRKDIPGRPMIYGSTKEFLELFNLKNLSELPSPKEITSLGNADSDDDMPPDDAERLTEDPTSADSSADVSLETAPAAAPHPATGAGAPLPETLNPDRTGHGHGATFADPDNRHPSISPGNEDDELSHIETSASGETQDKDPSTADETS